MAQARRIAEPEFDGPNFMQPGSMIVNRYKNLVRLSHPEVARFWGYEVNEGFSISLGRFNELGHDLNRLEVALCNRIESDLKSLKEIQEVKLLVCTKIATSDNYWACVRESMRIALDKCKVLSQAILDTGATTCCIDENSVPKEALEDNTFTVQFTGVNSKQSANKHIGTSDETLMLLSEFKIYKQ
ncbi:hypothetical protein EJ110_NYTH30613 [Nymphaea thermarum]|nr:hypothetical protein EJ110_NYTH30613 [Nymphaea thermarum]